MEVRWHLRGAWLLQAASAAQHAADGAGLCGGVLVKDVAACRTDTSYALALLLFLCSSIVAIMCAFAFFREDKEEQIMPLCPQLVVREPELHFSLPWDPPGDDVAVVDPGGRARCRAITDWPDPFRPGASGVAATVRLQNDIGDLLATVVARSDAAQGQGLALCKSGCKIFGFIEPDPPMRPRRYYVRHISGVHLLTLIGDFGALDVDAVNPAGSVVCSFKRSGAECTGRVLQHVDFGLMLCTLLAMRVHRQLAVPAAAAAASSSSAAPLGFGGQGHPPVVLGQLEAAGDPHDPHKPGPDLGPGPGPGPGLVAGPDPAPAQAQAGGPASGADAADAMARALAEPAEAAALAVGADSTGAGVASPAPPASPGLPGLPAAAGHGDAAGDGGAADQGGAADAAPPPPGR